MLFHVSHQLALVCQRKYFNVILLSFRRENDINLMSRCQAMLSTIPENHFEDHENIPDGFLAEAGCQFSIHQILHVLFLDIFPVSQFWQKMALYEQAVGCVG